MSLSPAPSFELDAGMRRRDGGRLLAGGMPPRLVRLSEAGARALDAILNGEPTADAATQRLARRLEHGGMIHSIPGDGRDDPDVTTIVPVLDGGERLADLVRVLAAEGPVIVVDDGSRDGSAERAERAGARVLRHDSPRGPAAARNAGFAAATTDLVAFLDADCEVEPGWRRGLAGLLLADPTLAVIAPRIRSTPGDSAVARFETTRSPLDLGPHASLVGPGRRTSYLPAAALLARRDALRELGGFDESLRYGEDVDLIWRALATTWRVRYVPRREIRHRPRATVGDLIRQRAGYGSSAPDLAARHGDAAAPLRASCHSAAIWASTLLLGPRALPAALATSTAIVARRGGDGPGRRALGQVALRGQVGAATHLARVLVREWLPLGVAAAPFSRRARRALLIALAADSLPAWRAAEGPAELAHASALHLLDRAAYAAGMWWAMAKRHDLRALLPKSATVTDDAGTTSDCR